MRLPVLSRRSVLLVTIAAGCGTACAGQQEFAGLPTTAARPGQPATANWIRLSDAGAGGARNWPLRIGQPFRQGEIAGAPQAVLDGTPLPTQADVKTRWPDGSVRHAILSMIVPRIPPIGSVVLSFTNQSGGAQSPLDKAAMLAPSFDFEAVIQAQHAGETRTASARAMLQAGHYTVWCSGPIATTVVIADHSIERRYDFGFDSLRSLRPIFVATFWPALRRVHVRVICENSNSETLEEVTYDLSVRVGLASPREVLRQANVPHAAATRWTRAYWLGPAPDSRINIDHNLAYLAATYAEPNYDTSLRVPEEVVAREYDTWARLPRGLYDPSGWIIRMGTTGGRDDIGPNPGHVTRWLYTGDHRLFEMTVGMAEQAGAWRVYVREGNPQKRMDKAGQVPGLGRPLSINAHPSLWLFDYRDHSTPEDRITIHNGPVDFGTGWVFDGAHQPDVFSALYLLTGDFFALENLQFWTASQALFYDPVYKGPQPSGVIFDQVRGDAWVFRTRTNATVLSPDGTPEREYFSTLMDDALAYWEGMHGISGTRYEDTRLWRYGRDHAFQPPLHYFDEQDYNGGDIFKPARVSTTSPLWQNYFVIFELARAREQGFATGPLLAWNGAVLTTQFADPQHYDPANVQRYYSPVRDITKRFYQTWPETLGAYLQPATPRIDDDTCDGYDAYAYGASTVLIDQPGGETAYAWLRSQVYERFRDRFAACPKWAFLPRA
jgi:hypothetical protein